MIEKQIDLELKYSKRHIQSVVLDYVDITSADFFKLTIAVRDYLHKEYTYASKYQRVSYLRGHFSVEQIALEILTTVLPIRSIIPIQGVCTKLGAIFGFKDEIEGVKTAAELLAVTEGKYFCLYTRDWWQNPTGTMGIANPKPIPEELQRELDQVQYVPPMVCPPKEWKSNTDGGHLTFKESVILGGMNHHNGNVSLDVVNYLQNVKYAINLDVLEQEETPKTVPDTATKLALYEEHKICSRRVYKQYRDREFYFLWKPDKRGRLYSQGYHMNPQGYQYKRALIDFHDKRVVTR